MQFACCRLNCIEPDSFCCIFFFLLGFSCEYVFVLDFTISCALCSFTSLPLLLLTENGISLGQLFTLFFTFRILAMLRWFAHFFFFLLLSLYLFSFFWLRAAPLFNFLLLFFRIHCIRLSWMQFFSLDDITERKRMATDAIIATVVS